MSTNNMVVMHLVLPVTLFQILVIEPPPFLKYIFIYLYMYIYINTFSYNYIKISVKLFFDTFSELVDDLKVKTLYKCRYIG